MIESFKRLRGRSAHEVAVRLRQYAQARMERAVPQAGFFPAATTWGAETNGGVPEFPLVASDGRAIRADDVVRMAADHDGEAIAAAISRASEAHSGRATLLGFGPLDLGNPPDWHREPISGRRSPRVHWSRVPYLDTDVVGDHKALWEPNRHQYLYAPALSWLVHRRSEDFDLVQRHLASWLDENPFRVGVNWASSLEVAYRAITWCWLFRLLADAPWNPVLVGRVTRSLERHAAHVERYLSTYFSPNTHLTGEALGLFYVGTTLPRAKHAGRWRDRGASILEGELDRQVRSDGTYFEQATGYHRYTTEIYLHYLRVSESAGRAVAPQVRRKLSVLFDVLRSLADGRGYIPLIGDDDGGLLLPLDHRPPDDVRGLLLAGAVALDRPDLAPDGAPPLMAAALCGYQATDRLVNSARATPGFSDRTFPHGGLSVLRDGWRPSDSVAVMDAGPHGALNCGHAHADALALTLSMGERPLFVDRGTLTYVGERRNEFRSTVSHNTVEIDATSSATPATPFAWEAITPAAPSAMGSAGPVRWVCMTAEGHLDSGRPSRHSRTVLHVAEGPWVIVDQVARDGGFRTAVGRWYLHPDCDARLTSDEAYEILIRGSRDPIARVDLLGAASSSLENRDVSLRLGAARPSKMIAGAVDAGGRLVTVVTPPAVERPPAGPRGVWTWHDAARVHEIIAPAPGCTSWDAFGLDTDAAMAWRIRTTERRGAAEPTLWIVLAGVRTVTLPGGNRFRSPPPTNLPGVLVLENSEAGWRLAPGS